MLGATMRQIAAEYREELIVAFEFRSDEVTDGTFRDETGSFMRKLARHLGDRPLNSRQLMRSLSQRPKATHGETGN